MSSPLDELQASAALFLQSRRALPARTDAIAFAASEISGNSRLSPGGAARDLPRAVLASAHLRAARGFSRRRRRRRAERLGAAVRGSTSRRRRPRATISPCSATLSRSTSRRASGSNITSSSPTWLASSGPTSWRSARKATPRLDPAAIAAVPDDAREARPSCVSPRSRLLRVSYPVVALRRSSSPRVKKRWRSPSPKPRASRSTGLGARARVEPVSEGAFALLEGLRDGKALMPRGPEPRRNGPGLHSTSSARSSARGSARGAATASSSASSPEPERAGRGLTSRGDTSTLGP